MILKSAAQHFCYLCMWKLFFLESMINQCVLLGQCDVYLPIHSKDESFIWKLRDGLPNMLLVIKRWIIVQSDMFPMKRFTNLLFNSCRFAIQLNLLHLSVLHLSFPICFSPSCLLSPCFNFLCLHLPSVCLVSISLLCVSALSCLSLPLHKKQWVIWL